MYAPGHRATDQMEDATTRAMDTSDDRLTRLVLAGVSLCGESSVELLLPRITALAADLLDTPCVRLELTGAAGRALQHSTVPVSDAPRSEEVVVPLIGHHGVIGHLALGEPSSGGALAPMDRQLAELLAVLIASAIENTRLHEESARLLAELHQLQRQRERLHAMVNHELCNALAATHGWAELVVRRTPPGNAATAAGQVLEAAQHATDIISDLLDLSRLDEDRIRLGRRPVDAIVIARRAIRRETPAANARGITITTTFAPDLPHLFTDPSRVEQILVNLLSNAIKYTRLHSTIHLSVHTDAAGVTFIVQDEGLGIRPEDAGRIFDLYFTTARDGMQGVGLGLPLSRRLARLLGGDLVALPAAGGGRFALTLPMATSA